MTPEQIQTEVLKIVCARFLNLKQATPRRGLVVKFQNPDVISEIARRELMREIGSRGEELYLPTSVSFSFCGDSGLAKLARKSIFIVLPVLKNMFEVETGRTNYTFEDLLNHARKMYDALDEDTLKLGLFLSRDFNVFNSWGTTQDYIEMTNFSISEDIVKMASPESQWEELIQSRSERKPMPNFSAGNTFNIGASLDNPFNTQQEIDAGFDWNLLHPAIREVAETRFCSKHFADSVEAALKCVNEKVQKIVKEVTGNEMDGSGLMNRAFSEKKPVLKLGALDTITGRNMQVGYMQIFAGSMTGIRNPKAHGNVVIDKIRAMHFLFLSSLLMHKIDEAEVVDSNTQTELEESVNREAQDASTKPSQ